MVVNGNGGLLDARVAMSTLEAENMQLASLGPSAPESAKTLEAFMPQTQAAMGQPMMQMMDREELFSGLVAFFLLATGLVTTFLLLQHLSSILHCIALHVTL